MGSFCTGTGVAERELGKSLRRWHEHRFSCERDPLRRAMIAANVDVHKQFTDTAQAWNQAPVCDILTAGFPCQPYSVGGVHGGLLEQRGLVIVHILLYIKKHMPRIVILENVPGLLHCHGRTLEAILTQLHSIRDSSGHGYYVAWKLLSANEYGGLPQHRVRLYIVAIKSLGRHISFKWPTQIAASPLSAIWDRDRKPLASYRAYPIPKTKTANDCVRRALAKICDKAEAENKKPHLYDVIVDIGTSSTSVGFDYSPTLTRTRCLSKDYWSMRHAARLTTTEMMRLQGFPVGDITIPAGVTDCQMAGMLGDAFAIPVMVRILECAVKAAESRS